VSGFGAVGRMLWIAAIAVQVAQYGDVIQTTNKPHTAAAVGTEPPPEVGVGLQTRQQENTCTLLL
jgi:hypothetical protein